MKCLTSIWRLPSTEHATAFGALGVERWVALQTARSCSHPSCLPNPRSSQASWAGRAHRALGVVSSVYGRWQRCRKRPETSGTWQGYRAQSARLPNSVQPSVLSSTDAMIVSGATMNDLKMLAGAIAFREWPPTSDVHGGKPELCARALAISRRRRSRTEDTHSIQQARRPQDSGI